MSSQSPTSVIKPPDGGWGWVICFSSFLIHVFGDGMSYSFGIFVEDFADYFDCGRSEVGTIGSLMMGVTWCTGPIASMLTNKYGCRIVTIAGAITATIGFIMSVFAPNIYFMYFSFGVVSGIGIGLTYLPAIVAVSFWFEVKRSLATGLAVCGSGIGTMIFSPLTRILLSEYGWKGTVLIVAAIMLNCIACGLLFKPVTEGSGEGSREQEMSLLNDISKNTISSSLPDVNPAVRRLDFQRKRVQSESLPMAVVKSVSHLRKDAFYSGNLSNIPMYNKSKQEYQQAVTSHDQGLNEKEKDCCMISRCLPSMSQLNEIMDPRLLCNTPFLLFCISNFLTSIGFSVPYIFLPDRGLQQGWAQIGDPDVSRQKLSTLIAIMGLLNTVGRVIFGWLADRKNVNRLFMYNTVLVLCGIFCILSCFCTSFISLAVYAGFYGFLIGVYVCLTPVVLVDLLGLEKLSNAFGVVLFFQGLGAVVGTPIAGKIFDMTNNYDLSFHFVGICILISGLMLYPIPWIVRKWETPESRELAMGKQAYKVPKPNVVHDMEAGINNIVKT